MIDGATITMGGRDWIVPPLNLKAIKKLGPAIEEIQKSTSQFDMLPVIGQLVLAALSRNYPDLSADEVDDMLDLSNSQTVMMAILATPPAGTA